MNGLIPLEVSPQNNDCPYSNDGALSELPSRTQLPGLEYPLTPSFCEKLVSATEEGGVGSTAVVQKLRLPKTKDVFELAFDGKGTFGDFECPTSDMLEVAIKIVPASETESVLREYQVLKLAANCPYIIDLVGCVAASSVYFFIEPMYGNCNEYYLNVKKLGLQVSEAEVKCIAFSVISALHFLQERGYMHRDVKPSNILIHKKGFVKLSDFGITRVLDKGCSNYTEVATKSYLPPERCRLFYELNHQKVPEGPKYEFTSDVWCLGVTLIEIGQMSHPYYIENSSLNDMDWNRELYDKLSEAGPELSGSQWSREFRSLVHDCVEPIPKNRPDYKTLLTYPFLADVNSQQPLKSKEISRKIERILASKKSVLESLPR